MKIYTKTGDAGETSLLGGPRVRKDHIRIEAYGTIDELNALLGVARAECDRIADSAAGGLSADLSATIGEVQHRLFDLGAELACPPSKSDCPTAVQDRHVEQLEAAIDRYEAALAPLRQFILPGGSAAAAQLHAARCVCRRAERQVVTLGDRESVRELALRYVNRLSDLLFVMARSANLACGVDDTAWVKDDAE